jgi:hypothetical protein
MKKLVSILLLCLLFLIACANNNNQIPESLSSSYDGIWDGYLQTPEGRQYRRQYIRMEIKKGIVSGFLEYNGYVNGGPYGLSEDKKIKGHINSDNNLIINPSYIKRTGPGKNYPPPTMIIFETNFMSPDRIEGTYLVAEVEKAPKYKWYVVKPATGKSDSTISNVEGN